MNAKLSKATIALGVLAIVGGTAANAQDYPAKTVRFIVDRKSVV